jgi:hypothetical protein
LVLVLVVVVLLLFWVVGIVVLDVGECWIMNDVWPPTTTRFIIFYFLLFIYYFYQYRLDRSSQPSSVIIQHSHPSQTTYQQCPQTANPAQLIVLTSSGTSSAQFVMSQLIKSIAHCLTS